MKIFMAGGTMANLNPLFKDYSMILRAEQSRASIYLAGNDGYHKTEEFLNEAREKMKIYLAGEGIHPYDKFLEEAQNQIIQDITNFEDFNILESYWDLQTNEKTMELLVRCGSYLIDSGAFTFLKAVRSESIDWDNYIERYADFLNRWKVQNFFELDIDSIVGLKEVERLRHKLEKLTNRQCIPVWHINRGKDYFIRMAEEYPYIALGGIALREVPIEKFEKYFPWFINTAHAHNAKIHGLGYTRLKNLRLYNFDSVDSTAWLYGNRAGYIYHFHPDTGEMEQIDKYEGTRLKPRMVALHNFVEWVKLGKYASKYY